MATRYDHQNIILISMGVEQLSVLLSVFLAIFEIEGSHAYGRHPEIGGMNLLSL